MTESRMVLRRQNLDLTRAARPEQILPLGPTLAVILSLTLASIAPAQSYRVLKSFSGQTDGRLACAGLVSSGNTLYGTTQSGGSQDAGVLFKINADGTGFGILRTFGTNDSNPQGELSLSNNVLYGTVYSGGHDRVFKLNTDGTGYSILISNCGIYWVILAGGMLYGTSPAASQVSRMNTDGSGWTVLKQLSGADGYCPEAGLVLAGSTLYGTTGYGGNSNQGVVFKINSDGSNFSVLKTFSGVDGYGPKAALIQADSTLYGIANGGISNKGVIFKINTDGSAFDVLKSFTGSEGDNPVGCLALERSRLYGVTSQGGVSNMGVIYMINTDGSGYAVLKSFNGADGANPVGGLTFAGGSLYGTTFGGGQFNLGVVFRLALPPEIIEPPHTQTSESGGTPEFSVAVENAPPAETHCQWYFSDTVTLGGATNSHLYLTNVQPIQAGSYTVVVMTLGGAVTSPPALLNVIAPVPRKTVPALTLMGQTETLLNLDSRTDLNSPENWATFDSVLLTSSPQSYFDITTPLGPQRFYRAWQTNVLSPPSVRDVHLVPAITVTGAIGSSVRLDYINQFGPIDAWVTLDTLTLTNTTQFYYDLTAIGQPARLYRLVALP